MIAAHTIADLAPSAAPIGRTRYSMRNYLLFLTIAVFWTLSAQSNSAHASEFKISLPVDCALGTDCFLQNYVDVVPGPDIGDYACGRATYDGHKGTDFRVLSTLAAQKSVDVLAAAPGRVRAIRDGVDDRLMSGRSDPAVKGRECGNGVVIDHGDGWQTQYCHLRNGSVRVKKGEQVAKGAPLGSIGFSGAAQFAHLHLAVRRDGKVIDPFLAGQVGSSCTSKPGAMLWDDNAQQKLAYSDGALIEQGFAAAPVKSDMLERGNVPKLANSSPALVYFVRFINLNKGDVVRMSLTGPGGIKVENSTEPVDRSKAQYVAFVGKKRRQTAWPGGTYQGTVSLLRQGRVVHSDSTQTELP